MMKIFPFILFVFFYFQKTDLVQAQLFSKIKIAREEKIEKIQALVRPGKVGLTAEEIQLVSQGLTSKSLSVRQNTIIVFGELLNKNVDYLESIRKQMTLTTVNKNDKFKKMVISIMTTRLKENFENNIASVCRMPPPYYEDIY